jgi:nucleoside-diphosphate-sugar epimerase
MLVLVTGATGRLGRVTCSALVKAGHRVRAVDQRFNPELPDVELLDMRDEVDAYRAVRGTDAVVHLANHPNMMVPISRQRLLIENNAMNANVFTAAVDVGIKCVVFSSSVQVTFSVDHSHAPGDPPSVPYLPADGNLPPNPGRNQYAQSKEFGERMLKLFVAGDPELSCTAYRFPSLVPDHMFERAKNEGRLRRWSLPVKEVMAYLPMQDAARLIVLTVEKRLPGYHQYFPAQCLKLEGKTFMEFAKEHYPEAEVRANLDEFGGLIDIRALQNDLGFKPEHEPLGVHTW